MPNYNRAPSAIRSSFVHRENQWGTAGQQEGPNPPPRFLFTNVILHQRVSRLFEEVVHSWYGQERFKMSLDHLVPKEWKCLKKK